MKISPELTFFPSKYPYEIKNHKEGLILIREIKKSIKKSKKIDDTWFLPKLDPFHNPHEENSTFCVEAVPATCLYTDWFEDLDWETTKIVITELFSIMKSHGLVPSLCKNRNRTEYHYPGGGCHLHVNVPNFIMSPGWYKSMEAFHRNLLIDYVNRPYLRWLFSNWFADSGSSVIVNTENFKKFKSKKNNIYDIDFFYTNAIEPRYMSSTKNSYLSFELRFFSMIHNPKELKLIVNFANRWIQHVLKKTQESEILGDTFYLNTFKDIPIEITHKKLLDMEDPKKSKEICKKFLDFLGLPWQDYEIFYDRNYSRRIKFGKFV
jgi:hypothetical protein